MSGGEGTEHLRAAQSSAAGGRRNAACEACEAQRSHTTTHIDLSHLLVVLCHFDVRAALLELLAHTSRHVLLIIGGVLEAEAEVRERNAALFVSFLLDVQDPAQPIWMRARRVDFEGAGRLPPIALNL